MKKIFKSRLFFLLIGVLIFGISAVFAYSYLASDIGYTSSDSDWNVDNTKDALDELYERTTKRSSVISSVTYTASPTNKGINFTESKRRF